MNWDQYGIDTSEPVTLSNDETAVIDDLPLYLRQTDYEWLQQQLKTGSFSEVLHNYVLATTYMHQQH